MIWEQALGPEHRDVAYYLDKLAWLYEATGRYEEAEPLYRRVVAILEKSLLQTIRTWRQSVRTTPFSSTKSAEARRPPNSVPRIQKQP